MASFIQGVSNALRGVVCQALNNPFVDGRQWGPTPPYVGDSVATNPLVRDWYNSRIDNMKAVFCDQVQPSDNVPPTDPVPGQCPGVGYKVRVRTYLPGQDPNICPPALAPVFSGPIRGLRKVGSSPAKQDWYLDYGEPVQSLFIQSYPAGNAESQGRICGITRPDGLPDNCGGGPGAYNPTTVINIEADITYVNNENVEVTQLGDFNLVAPIFLPGSITLNAPISIPFTLDVGGLTLTGEFFPDGTINFFPDGTINIGTDDNPVPPPGFEEPVPGPEYSVEPDPDQLNRIVGVWVEMLDPGRRATEAKEGDTTQYFPRWGAIKFEVQFGSGLALSPAVDLQTSRVYVPAPVSGRALGVRFFPYYGSEAKLTPAYADVRADLLLEPSE